MIKQDAIDKGANYYCPGCMTPYVHLPKYWDEQASCEGAYRTQCRHCDCDLILDLRTEQLVSC